MRYLLALIAGTTIFWGLAPHGLWYVALVGVVAFAALWQTKLSAKQSYFLAFAFHFGMFAAGVHWLYFSIHIHGQVPAFLTVLFVGLFSAALAGISSLPWLLSPFVRRKFNRLLAFPALWVFGEWGRSWILTGFPWLYLGQAHLHTPLAGWIPLFGVLGGSFALALTATALISIYTQRTMFLVVGQSLLMLAIWGGGSLLNQYQWTSEIENRLSVTMVQPNIPLQDKWNPSRASEIMSVLHSQSEPHWHDNLVIWPEAALPYTGEAAEQYLATRDELAKEKNAALVTGYLTYDPEIRRFYNAIGGAGSAEGIYLKQRLVPFGEYVPLENWLRGLMHFFDLPMSVISAGPTSQAPLSIDQGGTNYLAAPAICYEIAYPALVANLAREANLIITLSNDAWFEDSIGPWQHVEIAQLRALENRKPVIRVTNNGVSANIDHRGKIIDSMPQFEALTLTTDVVAMSGATPFSRFGQFPILLIVSLLFAWSAIWRRQL